MGNIFNGDFRDFIASLNHNGVRYILVGGYAVILHGYSRTTERSAICKEEELELRVIHKHDLIALKKKAGRSKDLDDLENLK